MRTVKPLTPAEILAAKPREKAYKLLDGGGLYLEVLTSGGKSWRMKYRMDDRENRITFGQFPEISLKDARKKRDETRELVAAGIDPIGYRKELEAEKAAAELRKSQTFQNIACEWFDKQTFSLGYLSKVQS